MNLESKIQSALTEAMRNRNEGALRALRAVKSAILLAKTSGGSAAGGLKPEDEIKLLQNDVGCSACRGDPQRIRIET